MSDSMVLVRFDDGDVRCAYFFGGIEAVVPVLFPLGQADEVFDGGMDAMMDILVEVEPSEAPEVTERVELWCDGYPELWWEGRASRDPEFLWDGVTPFGVPGTDGEGAAELHDGTPDWIPDNWR